jgi:hypothetical protein
VISVVRPCSDAPGRTLERRFHLVRSTPRSRLGDIFLWCLVDHLSLVEPIRTSLCRCAAFAMVVTSSGPRNFEEARQGRELRDRLSGRATP